MSYLSVVCIGLFLQAASPVVEDRCVDVDGIVDEGLKAARVGDLSWRRTDEAREWWATVALSIHAQRYAEQRRQQPEMEVKQHPLLQFCPADCALTRFSPS